MPPLCDLKVMASGFVLLGVVLLSLGTCSTYYAFRMNCSRDHQPDEAVLSPFVLSPSGPAVYRSEMLNAVVSNCAWTLWCLTAQHHAFWTM